MKACIHTKYGPPEVLRLTDIPKPIPKDNELLVKIYATTVNRTDSGFRNPEYLAVRVVGGLFKPKNLVLGTELAGEVEAIGKNVKLFKVGDKVFGLNCMVFGAHAEYICVPEEGSIALMPEGITYEEAAASLEGPWLANTYFKKVKLRKDHKILINGATGSIGSAGVQLAKYFGAEVTATSNTKNMELIKSLGADEVIDHTKEDFTKREKLFDFVFDAVGKSSYFKCKKLLKPRGVYFSTELGYLSQNIFLALFTPLLGAKKVIFPIPKETKTDIEFIKDLIEHRKYKALIDRTYAFDAIIEATRYVDTGQKTGNIAIKIVP